MTINPFDELLASIAEGEPMPAPINRAVDVSTFSARGGVALPPNVHGYRFKKPFTKWDDSDWVHTAYTIQDDVLDLSEVLTPDGVGVDAEYFPLVCGAHVIGDVVTMNYEVTVGDPRWQWV